MTAIFFGVGLLKPAAGTWGSAAALLLGMVILHFIGFYGLAGFTLLATLAGFWACNATLTPSQDPGEVVIDEVAGQWLTLLFPAAGFWFSPMGRAAFDAAGQWMPWPAWLVPFAMFRLFDIWKPWIIGKADLKGTPSSVMEDDLWAGLFAGIATVVLAAAYHIPLILMAQK